MSIEVNGAGLGDDRRCACRATESGMVRRGLLLRTVHCGPLVVDISRDGPLHVIFFTESTGLKQKHPCAHALDRVEIVTDEKNGPPFATHSLHLVEAFLLEANI